MRSGGIFASAFPDLKVFSIDIIHHRQNFGYDKVSLKRTLFGTMSIFTPGKRLDLSLLISVSRKLSFLHSGIHNT